MSLTTQRNRESIGFVAQDLVNWVLNNGLPKKGQESRYWFTAAQALDKPEGATSLVNIWLHNRMGVKDLLLEAMEASLFPELNDCVSTVSELMDMGLKKHKVTQTYLVQHCDKTCQTSLSLADTNELQTLPQTCPEPVAGKDSVDRDTMPKPVPVRGTTNPNVKQHHVVLDDSTTMDQCSGSMDISFSVPTVHDNTLSESAASTNYWHSRTTSDDFGERLNDGSYIEQSEQLTPLETVAPPSVHSSNHGSSQDVCMKQEVASAIDNTMFHESDSHNVYMDNVDTSMDEACLSWVTDGSMVVKAEPVDQGECQEVATILQQSPPVASTSATSSHESPRRRLHPSSTKGLGRTLVVEMLLSFIKKCRGDIAIKRDGSLVILKEAITERQLLIPHHLISSADTSSPQGAGKMAVGQMLMSFISKCSGELSLRYNGGLLVVQERQSSKKMVLLIDEPASSHSLSWSDSEEEQPKIPFKKQTFVMKSLDKLRPQLYRGDHMLWGTNNNKMRIGLGKDEGIPREIANARMHFRTAVRYMQEKVQITSIKGSKNALKRIVKGTMEYCPRLSECSKDDIFKQVKDIVQYSLAYKKYKPKRKRRGKYYLTTSAEANMDESTSACTSADQQTNDTNAGLGNNKSSTPSETLTGESVNQPEILSTEILSSGDCWFVGHFVICILQDDAIIYATVLNCPSVANGLQADEEGTVADVRVQALCEHSHGDDKMPVSVCPGLIADIKTGTVIQWPISMIKSTDSISQETRRMLLKVGAIIAVAYKTTWFPGVLESVNDDDKMMISFMRQKDDIYSWPKRPNILDVEKSSILPCIVDLVQKKKKQFTIGNKDALNQAYALHCTGNNSMPVL